MWTTITLGRGKALPRWPRDASKELRQYDARAIHAAMLAAYPFLADLHWIVPADLRAAHDDRRELVALVLQGIEAQALTGAIFYVTSRGHLALPTHDGLIVAASAEHWAVQGLEGGYRYFAKLVPRVEVARFA